MGKIKTDFKKRSDQGFEAAARNSQAPCATSTPKKLVLAVSGGIDSMVMLDVLLRSRLVKSEDLIVAHFDHGARDSSRMDAHFVEHVAIRQKLDFRTMRAELGEDVAEDFAREQRYNFLQQISQASGNATICTAHHLDDLTESVAINLLRGTGWRGLAALDRPGSWRPFLDTAFCQIFNDLLPGEPVSTLPISKNKIRQYAAQYSVVFRQDQSNNSEKYLRNRVRKQLDQVESDAKLKIFRLWQQQKLIKQELGELLQEVVPAPGEIWQREWFSHLDDWVAVELLRAGTQQCGIKATRPQLSNFLKAIRTYNPGKCFNLPGDNLVKFSKTDFSLTVL